MTERRIANTDIKVSPFGYNCWQKGTFKKNSFYIEERNLILNSKFLILREAYGLLFSDIKLKR